MSDYFPVEVVLEILKRLPVKSLLRCKSVCKNWNTLICNSSFISTHLQASLSKPNDSTFLVLRCYRTREENFFLDYDNDDFDEFKQLKIPVSYVPYSKVVGSCNGLICLNFCPRYYLNFIIWNPSIRKYISLPQPSTCFYDYYYDDGDRDDDEYEDKGLILGFGFHSRTNDYKLFVFGVQWGETLIEPLLFSLNENCWKRVTSVCPKHYVKGITSSTIVNANGAVHWLGFRGEGNEEYNNTILGFDLSSEEFFEISLPESLVGVWLMDLSTMKYQESSIAVLRRDWAAGEFLDLWVMKKYAVVETWTKVLALHLTPQNVPFPRVLGFRKNGEVLFQVDIDGEMASLDLNCSQTEPRGLGVKVGEGLISVDSYVESLVLLDKAESSECRE